VLSLRKQPLHSGSWGGVREVFKNSNNSFVETQIAGLLFWLHSSFLAHFFVCRQSMPFLTCHCARRKTFFCEVKREFQTWRNDIKFQHGQADDNRAGRQNASDCALITLQG
jgi:hypothetical protein